VKVSEHLTSPPSYLSESELISLMEKHGIGTVSGKVLGLLVSQDSVQSCCFCLFKFSVPQTNELNNIVLCEFLFIFKRGRN